MSMYKSKIRLVTTLSIVLTLPASAKAQRLPPDVVVSHPQVYEVTITTKFVTLLAEHHRDFTPRGVVVGRCHVLACFADALATGQRSWVETSHSRSRGVSTR
jgi:hypothetical protein